MINIIPNFVSENDCNNLVDWILNNHHKFEDAKMGGIRKTTRFLNNDIVFPQTALELRNKIKKTLNLKDEFRPPFIDGMVASFAEPEDTCFEHTDPVWFKDHYTLHCNVLVQKPDFGGDPIIDGKKYELNQGDLLCYYVSHLKHGSTKVIGNKNRLMWIFGFCVHK
jgi:hypothetical protein